MTKSYHMLDDLGPLLKRVNKRAEKLGWSSDGCSRWNRKFSATISLYISYVDHGCYNHFAEYGILIDGRYMAKVHVMLPTNFDVQYNKLEELIQLAEQHAIELLRPVLDVLENKS